MSEPKPPVLWLVAGPDGVGKTTYAFRHIRSVSGSVHFVNVDEIARGLSPLQPDIARRAAARVALTRIDQLMADRETLSIETTLAGLGHLRTIEQARASGYATRLLYFMTANVDACLGRVARRVAEGGHDVPEADVRRRYARSIGNFASYGALCGTWRIFDANGSPPLVVAEGRNTCIAVATDMNGLPEDLARCLAAFPPCAET
ncbi:MAG: hypothetical protein SH859_01475 [Hyphomicrobium aestuarii]|nr:hypothetical protein [Hyphomicrobium aestuarii]